MYIPDYLIIDDIKRRKERSWQPESLPLYVPEIDDDCRKDNKGNQEKNSKDEKVIIIDLNEGIYF